ncbi:MAG: hypothetical protein ACD_40C00068G0002 [uncultured bacterium]|nr:MAG: hypothetical protein ACD_40C00068G0002 [uncultured bacterium]
MVAEADALGLGSKVGEGVGGGVGRGEILLTVVVAGREMAVQE